jgi:capsid protein
MSRKNRKQAARRVASVPQGGFQLQARHEAAETNAANANHYALADSMSARTGYSPARRRTLRMRSRYEAENNSWLAGMLRTASNHIVGTGPSLQVMTTDREANARLEWAWNHWTGTFPWVEMLKLAVRADWCDGECVGLRLSSGHDPDMDLGVRLYEAEQLSDPWQSPVDHTVEDGVRIDDKTGVPVEYHLLRRHPGDRIAVDTLQGDWMPAADVIHTFRMDRPGQLRGIPRIAPALEDFIKQRRWEIATLRAAENAALQATAIRTNSASVEAASSPGDFLNVQLPDSGATILPEGWDIQNLKPEHPTTNHEAYTRVNLTKTARCLNMPYHVASGTSRDSNFSSANMDLRLAWVGEVKSEQLRFEMQFVRRVVAWFLDSLVTATGKYRGVLDGLPAISDIPYTLTWDPIPTVDELDSAAASADRMATGLSSLSEELGGRGKDASSSIAKAASDLGLAIPNYLSLVRTKLFGMSFAEAAADPSVAASANVAATALNGAQIVSLLQIVSQVVDGRLPAESARSAMKMSFPTLRDEQIDELLTPLEGFTPKVSANGEPVAPVADESTVTAPTGEFGGLNRRQWSNNRKAIRDVLEEMASGQQTEAAARVFLQTVGLTPESIDTLIQDAMDGLVDTPELQASGPQTVDLPATLTLAAAGEAGPRKFDILAYTGGTLPVKGAPLPVIVDLRGMSIPNSVPLLLNHTVSTDTTLGQATEINNDGQQITMQGVITGQSEQCLEVLAQHDKGHKWQASIGAYVVEAEQINPGARVVVNGQEFFGPVIVARRSELRETSVTPMGADSRTMVNLAASAALQVKGSVMTFEDYVKSLGLDPATLTPEATAALQMAFEAMSTPAESVEAAAPAATAATAPAAAPVAVQASADLEKNLQATVQLALTNHRKAISEETRYARQVSEMCAGFPKIEASAIENHWSLEKVELEVMKQRQRGHAPSAHIPSATSRECVIEAALCIAGGMQDIEKRFAEQTLDAAHKEFKSSIGLQDMLHIAASGAGWSGRSVKADMRGMLQAAFSTTSLPGILANVANKFLLEGFMSVEDTWRQICSIRNVSDFKTATSYRLTGAFQYDKVGPGGELKHGSVSEESYTNKAETYGKMFAVTRQDIINDDLGALTDLPRRIGRGAALKLNDVFWTAFLADHATFFTTGRGNYFEGATTNLSIASLTQAETLFLDAVDPDGKPLSIEPSLLLVPNALNTLATSISRDLEIRDTTTSKVFTTGNPHAGKFRPIRSSYLGNASYGNSTTAWYLLADPQSLSMIEVCFLNGQQNPTVETADADFNTLGIQMRGYHDFGVSKQDYRAAVKSKGAA